MTEEKINFALNMSYALTISNIFMTAIIWWFQSKMQKDSNEFLEKFKRVNEN